MRTSDYRRFGSWLCGLAVGLLILATAGHAAPMIWTPTQTATGSVNDTLTLTGFDTGLGALRAVELNYQIDWSLEGGALGLFFIPWWANAEVDTTFDGPGSSADWNDAQITPVTTTFGPFLGYVEYEASGSALTTFLLNNPIDLSFYTAPAFNVANTTSFDVEAAWSYLTCFTGTGDITVDVRYQYEIPEPTVIGLLAAGLAGLGAWSRRTAKKR